MTRPIEELNIIPRDQAVALMELLVERSPWVAELTVDARPFQDHEAVTNALVETVLHAGHKRQLAMFNAHPELAGREASENSMTAASTGEQGRLGLLSLSPANARRLRDLNAAYRTRFGHPFIIALHRIETLDALFTIFESRLAASAMEEHAATLAEIASVIASRAAQAFGPASRSTPSTTAATQE